MTGDATEILQYAVRLLARRDYSIVMLRNKLADRFGVAPDEIIEQLVSKRFLNDRRFTENYVARRRNRGETQLRQELLLRGIAAEVVEEALAKAEWPSLREAVTAKMVDWKLHAPLQPRDATRLFRALARLGYEEDAIREEIEQLT